jgi:hypothetical protein
MIWYHAVCLDRERRSKKSRFVVPLSFFVGEPHVDALLGGPTARFLTVQCECKALSRKKSTEAKGDVDDRGKA